MGRKKILIDRISLVTNVSMNFKIHLEEVRKKISKERGKIVTLSEMIREALLKNYPITEDQNELSAG